MILGTGIDIVDIDRIRAVLERHQDRFLSRLFSPDEIKYCMKRHDPLPCLAARFATKEATVKALGTGFSKGIGFKDVVVVSRPGRPTVRLSGNAKKVADSMRMSCIHLSISHERKYAVAVVVIENS